jgi:hypothetical protein
MKIAFIIKNSLIATCLVIVSVCAGLCQVTPQDPTNLLQEFNIKIDKLGDATLELSQKMTAEQWENFRQSTLMNDVSIAKRNLENSMSTYDVEDFKRDIDELNRTVKMTISIKAYAQYKGNGDWVLKSDTKNPQVNKLTDQQFMITGNSNIGGLLVQQIIKIQFPDGSTNVQQTTDTFGKAIFTYKLGGGIMSYMAWNNIVGLLLVLCALGVFVKSLRQSPKPS